MQTVRTNLTNNASTQYTNFNYNSLCRFNGVTLGAGDAGLFKACCGPDDNGIPISAYFTPLMTNLGTMNLKRAWYLYMGFQCNGSMIMTMTADEETTSAPYAIAAVTTKGQQAKRTPLSRLLAWTYGSFKFANVDGSDFSVDSIKLVIKELSRGGR